MTKIIPFEPIKQTVKTQQPQNVQTVKIKQEPIVDTFEFTDGVIEEQVKIPKVKEPKIPKNQLVAVAWNHYDKALKTREKVQKLLNKAEEHNYEDMLDNKGNLVTFEEDTLGRTVMIECDEKGRDKRRTTLTPDDENILKIITVPHTQVIFFDYGKEYTEVIKLTKPNILGKSTREVFCYENGKPISYSKYNQNLFADDVLVETCEF